MYSLVCLIGSIISSIPSQDIVTRNIHELGSKALNTTEIAKQCKHLMVTHNIGQRLFAKYVMNQVVKVFDSLIFVFHFDSLN